MSAKPLNVADAADYLGVSERMVLDELRRKNLRGSKLPGRAGWRIELDDLRTYLDAKANVRPVKRGAA